MKLRQAILLILALGLVPAWQCNSQPPPVAPNDAGFGCEGSCANQRRLNCKGASGKSTPSGRTCEDVCKEQDPLVNLHTDCVARAQNCNEVYACFP